MCQSKRAFMLVEVCVGLMIITLVTMAAITASGTFEQVRHSTENVSLAMAYTIDSAQRLQKELDTEGTLDAGYQYSEGLARSKVDVDITTSPITSTDAVPAYKVMIKVTALGISKTTNIILVRQGMTGMTAA